MGKAATLAVITVSWFNALVVAAPIGATEGVSERCDVPDALVPASRLECVPFKPSQIGFPVSIEAIGSSGREGWESLAEARCQWSGVVSAPGAQALFLHFSSAEVPDGWSLSLVDTSGQMVWELPKDLRSLYGSEFWSPVVVGDTVRVVLAGPAESAASARVGVDQINYVFRGFGPDDRDTLLPCQDGVRCVAGNNAARNSVGRMSYTSSSGAFLASCVLIADSNLEDAQGYVYCNAAASALEVFHPSITIHWRWWPLQCNFSPPVFNNLPQNHGASVLARSDERDFSLLQLWEPVPGGAGTGPGYAAWTGQDPVGELHAYHHPLDETMRIASGQMEPPVVPCPQYPETDFIFHDFVNGAMQPGSAGGGVFDENWNLVGILSDSCGLDGVIPDCDNHAEVTVVTSRLSSALPDMLFWLNNEPFEHDEFEPNNTWADAALVGEGVYDLTLLEDGYDWYAVDITCSGNLRVQIDFAEVHMRPELSLWEENGYYIQDSELARNGHAETSLPVAPGQRRLIRVRRAEGLGGPYRMTISVEDQQTVRTVAAPLPPPPAHPGNLFTFATAMNEQYLFVGAAWSDEVAFRAGAVFVYKRVADGSWCLSQTLLPETAEEWQEFGRELALSRDGLLFVGAPRTNGVPTGRGTVHLFELMDGQWERTQTILPPNGRTDDWFGYSIAVDGQYAIIGAPQDNLYGATYGAAYIYGTFGSPDGRTWIQQARIESTQMGEHPRLGYDVAISGTTGFATTPGASNFLAGMAVVIKRQPTFTWAVSQVLGTETLVGDAETILVQGEQLFLGSNFGDNYVHMFERFEGAWWFIGSLTPPHFGSEFGAGMVGAGDELAFSHYEVGAIYRYRQVPFAVPELIEEIWPADPHYPEDAFGWALATDGKALVIDSAFTTQWESDCNGDGQPDDCQIFAGELSDDNGNGIADECEQPACYADLAEPQGTLDFFDVMTYLDYFSSGDPRADLSPPYCQLDFFDILGYLNIFASDCP